MTNNYNQQNQNISGNQINIGGVVFYINKSSWPQQVREWVYKDFVYTYPKDFMWAKLGSKGYTLSGAKLEFWQNSQREIFPKIQQWLDRGWEPVGEISSACIEIRTSTGHKDKTAGYWAWNAFGSLFTFGLSLILAAIDVSEVAEPTRFVIQMRHPKQ